MIKVGCGDTCVKRGGLDDEAAAVCVRVSE